MRITYMILMFNIAIISNQNHQEVRKALTLASLTMIAWNPNCVIWSCVKIPAKLKMCAPQQQFVPRNNTNRCAHVPRATKEIHLLNVCGRSHVRTNLLTM